MPASYRFGEFKLLPSERLLFRRGREVALTARAFDLLVAFAERAGQLLSKDDLMRRVWRDVVVEENNLAVQVGALRRVLGSESITTIPGFGYRFAIDVIDVGPGTEVDAEPAGPGNLPRRLPGLIGRQAELRALEALVRSDPLVTICGGPGFGKTRLALELARRLAVEQRDGAWWVDLTRLRDGEPPACLVGRALDASVDDGEPSTALARRLRTSAMLIVLDNAEHRVDDVAELAAALVRDTVALRILVTSQVPLRVPGERLYRLSPLSPDDAVRLFAERASGASWQSSDGQRAAEICRALDGNALAIELAAARVDALGLDGLAARLHQRLTLLAPGDTVRPSRHNALSLALRWSYDLLSDRERRVLRRLAVFPGSFSLEAAALVVGADGTLPAARIADAVLSLVDRSLISPERGPSRRFVLLETTRLFALERLDEEGESRAAQASFASGMRWLLDDAYEESWRTSPASWRARYGVETPASWVALAWAIEHDVETAAALFGASTPLWRQSAQASASAQARALAERLTDAVDAGIRARFWLGYASAHSMSHPGLARDGAERAAALYRALGDARGEYLALVTYAFNWRVDGHSARLALARAKSLENPGWPASVVAEGLTTEAVLHLTAGRYDDGRRCYLEALDVCRRGGFDHGAQRALLNLADLERAAGRLDESIRIGRELRDSIGDDDGPDRLASALTNLVGALIEQGDHEAARDVALDCRRRVGPLALEACGWVSLDALGRLHLHDGRTAVAARLAGAADREFERHGQPQRQPNEAADRAALAAALDASLAPADVARLRLEGRRMTTFESLALAFDVERRDVAH